MAKHQIPQLDAEARERHGSRYAARLRDAGRLPAVIYGHKQDAVSITLDAKAFSDVVRQHTHVINVAVNSALESCLVKEVQWNHLGTQVIHVDLARVDLTERVETEVGLEFVGDPKAAKEAGAVLEHVYSSIGIECEAGNIPDSIRVDISEITRERPVTVADLKLPEGVTCTMDAGTVIASISFVAEQEEAPLAEAGPAEPEVITARKEKEQEPAEKKK